VLVSVSVNLGKTVGANSITQSPRQKGMRSEKHGGNDSRRIHIGLSYVDATRYASDMAMHCSR
jgi:hypothetical protein